MDEAFNELLSNGPELSKRALEKLLAGSRQDPDVRKRLAEPAVLDVLLGLIEKPGAGSILELSLSCIGNAVIDNDAARSHITEGRDFPDWAARLIDEERKPSAKEVALVVAVLNNLCTDYPPALKACARSQWLFRGLVGCLRRRIVSENDVPLAIDLLFRIGNQGLELAEEESRSIDLLRPSDLPDLFELPHLYSGSKWSSAPFDAEDWASLVSIVLLFAKQDEWLQHIIRLGLIDSLMQLGELNEALVDHIGHAADEDDVKLVAPLSASIMWTMSDAASHLLFREHYPVDDEPRWRGLFKAIHDLDTIDQSISKVTWSRIGSGKDETDMQKRAYHEITSGAACQVLANALWTGKPSETQIETVMNQHIHEPILAGIISSHSANTLHTITGLLWMWLLTAKSPEVSDAVGANERIMPALQKLLAHDMPQVAAEGKNLLRALGKYSERNRAIFKGMGVQAAIAEYNENNQDGPQMSIQAATGGET